MDDSTLKPQAYASKDKATYDDNVAYLASIILFNNLHDNSEATDTDPFSDSSDITSTDSSIFDSSDASSIIDSSVFIDCSI